MTFDEYQAQALTTDTANITEDLRPNANDSFNVDKVLGLVGEAGEVAEKYKKIIRDKEGIISEEDRKELIKELGDVLWYIAVLAEYLGADFSDVAAGNLAKLADRNERNVIKSEGDNR